MAGLKTSKLSTQRHLETARQVCIFNLHRITGAYCMVRWAHPSKDVPQYTVVLHDSSVAASGQAGAVTVVREGMTLSEAHKEAAARNQDTERADQSSRRIAQRYAFETRFRIRLRRNTRNLRWEGWAYDLSESGLGAFVGQTLHSVKR